MTLKDGDKKGRMLRIHFPSFIPTGFSENKISFHESGYIHSTDRNGQRYRDGVVGIPFREIKSCHFVLAVAPRNPTEMPELEVMDERRDIKIDLPEDVAPFVVQFAIARKSINQMPDIPQEQMFMKGYIRWSHENKEFDLLIAMTKVLKSNDSDVIMWPPFPLVLKNLG